MEKKKRERGELTSWLSTLACVRLSLWTPLSPFVKGISFGLDAPRTPVLLLATRIAIWWSRRPPTTHSWRETARDEDPSSIRRQERCKFPEICTEAHRKDIPDEEKAKSSQKTKPLPGARILFLQVFSYPEQKWRFRPKKSNEKSIYDYKKPEVPSEGGLLPEREAKKRAADLSRAAAADMTSDEERAQVRRRKRGAAHIIALLKKIQKKLIIIIKESDIDDNFDVGEVDDSSEDETYFAKKDSKRKVTSTSLWGFE